MVRFVIFALALAAVVPFVPVLVERSGWIDDRQNKGGGQEVALPDVDRPEGASHRISKSRNGHYVAETRINGHFFEMLIDTGASVVALPERVAEEAGINLQSSDFTVPIGTANGTTYGGAAVIRELRVGQIRLRDVEVLVLRDQALQTPLLGMSALNQLQSFDFSNDTLLLVQ